MDLLENAASAISSRNTRSHHSKSHRGHRSDREYRKHREHRDRDHKSRSRSRSRSRHSRHSKTAGSTVGVGSVVGGGGLTGLAASFFGGGGGDDVDGFDYGEDYSNYKPPHKSSKHRDRGRGIDDDDDTRSFFSGIGGGKDGKNRGFFGLTGGDTSRSGFFSGFGGRSGTPASSYYKRSPRPSFVSRMMKKLKRLLRDLVYYAKRHPLKVFMVVIMPLVTGGFLTALLAKVGIRLPKFVERMLGMAAKASTGDSIGVVGEAMKMVSGGGSKRGGGGLGGAAVNYAKSTFEKGSNGGMQWERRSVEKDYFGGNVGSAALKGAAKMFS